MTALAQRFIADDSGATAIEYGLIVAMIAVGCIMAIMTLGGGITDMFAGIRDRAGGAMDAAGANSSAPEPS
jgi:pilus assembly protein Flp/PilA